MNKVAAAKKPAGAFLTRIRKELAYQIMVWMALIFTIIFSYIPMSGIIIAFKNYSFRKGIFGSPWVGLDNFRTLFTDFHMGNAVVNTLGLAALSVALSFPATIIFTLLINELTYLRFKKAVQTVSYLPHFISWAVMAIILDSMLNTNDGVINMLMMNIGLIKEPIFWLGREELYWPMVIAASIWKELGWSAIVYLAAINGIDETLYEAAKIDGATRMQRIRYITLPALSGIISIMLILTMGGIVNTGFDQAFFLENSLNHARSNVLSYYVYNVGLVKADFSYSTAIGLVLSCCSATLMLTANAVVKRLNGEGLF